MTQAAPPNLAQSDYWNSAPGKKWIEHEGTLDTAMSGILDLLLRAADLRSGQTVLDVGCGTGASTLAAAQQVGEAGHVVAVDISQPLLDRAARRAGESACKNVTFTAGDAQSYAFERARFDRMISRLGVMFFASPVDAFANIAKAIKPGGRMVFVAWAAAAKNPWFTIPAGVARSRLGTPTATDPTAPGPLAFANLDRVARMMAEAGLSDISATEQAITLEPPGGIRGAAAIASRVGPVARIMKEFNGTEADLAFIEAEVAKALAEFATANGVKVPGAVNLFASTCG